MPQNRIEVEASIPKGRLIIISEPDCTQIHVPGGESIVIVEDTKETGDSMMRLDVSVDDDGSPVVSVWPDAGNVRFEKNGEPIEAGVEPA